MNCYRTLMDRLMVEVHQENRRVVQYLRETIFFMCTAFILAFKLVMTNVSYLSCFYASYILMKIACEYKITGLQFMQFLGIYIGFIIVGVIMVLVCVSDMLIDRKPTTEEHENGIITEMGKNVEEPEEHLEFQTIKDKFEALKLRTIILEKEFDDEDEKDNDETRD
jgi:hypothetical protein